MPRSPRSEPLPFFVSAFVESAALTVVPASPELLTDVVALLRDAGGHVDADIEAQIAEAADEFEAGRSTAPYYGRPGQQKELLKRLGSGGRVLPILDRLAPEFIAQLQLYFHEAEAAWVNDPIGEPVEVIARVRCAARKFYQEYKPADGRTTDLPLETAVRTLADLVEQVLGCRPLVSMNKNNAASRPTPRCAGARAIERLVTGIDPGTTGTAVMNMIVKVANQAEPTPDPLDRLIDSSLIGALQLSLLPGRAEAITRLRNDPFCFDREPEQR